MTEVCQRNCRIIPSNETPCRVVWGSGGSWGGYNIIFFVVGFGVARKGDVCYARKWANTEWLQTKWLDVSFNQPCSGGELQTNSSAASCVSTWRSSRVKLSRDCLVPWPLGRLNVVKRVRSSFQLTRTINCNWAVLDLSRNENFRHWQQLPHGWSLVVDQSFAMRFCVATLVARSNYREKSINVACALCLCGNWESRDLINMRATVRIMQGLPLVRCQHLEPE